MVGISREQFHVNMSIIHINCDVINHNYGQYQQRACMVQNIYQLQNFYVKLSLINIDTV